MPDDWCAGERRSRRILFSARMAPSRCTASTVARRKMRAIPPNPTIRAKRRPRAEYSPASGAVCDLVQQAFTLALVYRSEIKTDIRSHF